jgi:hypothetical protein
VLTLVVGFLASAILYIAAIYGFVWAGTRRMGWGARQGVALSPEPQLPSAAEIWKRHSVEMTVLYGVLFAVLALVDFTIWQRLGFAALSALVFGSLWVANSSISDGLPGVSSVRRSVSTLGYWCLAVADWFGYFGVLCFGTAIIMEMI